MDSGLGLEPRTSHGLLPWFLRRRFQTGDHERSTLSYPLSGNGFYAGRDRRPVRCFHKREIIAS